MPNLLYVTSDLLKKLQTHPAYEFWAPIMNNFPIRPVPLDERSFHPRNIKVEEGYIYLTTDMKFVYCRDGMCSFMYEDQDLSFRLSPSKGILQTVDGKEFTAVIGRIAEIASTSDATLIDLHRVYHSYMDRIGLASKGQETVIPDHDADTYTTAAEKRNKGQKKPKKATQKAKAAAKKRAVAQQKAGKKESKSEKTGEGKKILGKYDQEVCDEMVAFRNSSKKSYKYLGQKFDMPVDDVKEIIKIYAKNSRQTNNKAGRAAIAKIPDKTQAEIVRMKKVSKKSYKFLAKRFDLKIDVVKEICAQHLKRPRRS